MDLVADRFAPLLGRPCWAVEQGFGSFVTLEFGEPRERPDGSIRGQWHLWVYCCEWSLARNGVEMAHSESDRALITGALSMLNGQLLTKVDLNDAGRSTLRFDVGCDLHMRPAPPGTYDDPVEQWMLFEPSGDVLSLLSDGTSVVTPAARG